MTGCLPLINGITFLGSIIFLIFLSFSERDPFSRCFLLGFIGLMLVMSILAWVGSDSAERQRQRRFESREELTSTEFYVRYYGESGIPESTVAAFFLQASEAVQVPMGRLRPGDRFAVELAVPGWEYGDYVVALERRVRIHLKRQGINLPKLATLDDFIRAVAGRHDIHEAGPP